MEAGLCGQVKVVSVGVPSLFLLTCDPVFLNFLDFFTNISVYFLVLINPAMFRITCCCLMCADVG